MPGLDDVKFRLNRWGSGAQFWGDEHGLLGRRNSDGTYTYKVSGRPGYYYVQVVRGDTATLTEAIAAGTPRIGGLPVRLARTSRGEFKIDGPDWEYAVAQYGETAQAAAIAEHSHTSPIPTRRLLDGLVYPTDPASLSVTVAPCFYMDNGDLLFYPGGTLDLTSHVPTDDNKRRWVLVGIDPATNTATALDGADVTFAATLTGVQLAAIDPAGIVPLAGVNLRTGATAINAEALFMDARVWLTGTGGGARSLTVEETDGSPSVADVITLVFPAGTVTDNGGGEVEITPEGLGGQTYTNIAQLTAGRDVLDTPIGGLSSSSYAVFPNKITWNLSTTWYGIQAYIYDGALNYTVEIWNAADTVKLAESASVAGSGSAGWVDLPFTSSLAVTAGVTYKVKVIPSSDARMYATTEQNYWRYGAGIIFYVDNDGQTSPYPPMKVDYDAVIYQGIDLIVPPATGVQVTASVQTTDATVTNIATLGLDEGEAVTVRGIITGLKSDGSAACGGDFRGTFRRATSGNVTLVGSVTANVAEDHAGSPTFTLAAETTTQTVDIRVTGIAAETWDWQVMYDYIKTPAA